MILLRQSVLLFSVLALFGGSLGCGSGGDSGSDSPAQTGPCATLGEKIFGGAVCSNSRSPVALIRSRVDANTVLRCSGTLVTKNQVLTAAHCFTGTNGDINDVRVFFENEEFNAQSVTVNPDYLSPDDSPNGGPIADIAVITLSSSAPADPVPIEITDSVVAGDPLSIFAYSRNDAAGDGSPSNYTLLAADITVALNVGEFFVSSSAPLQPSACSGDSGGPAVSRVGSEARIVGIVNARVGDCGEQNDTIFASVNYPPNVTFLRGIVPAATFR